MTNFDVALSSGSTFRPNNHSYKSDSNILQSRHSPAPCQAAAKALQFCRYMFTSLGVFISSARFTLS